MPVITSYPYFLPPSLFLLYQTSAHVLSRFQLVLVSLLLHIIPSLNHRCTPSPSLFSLPCLNFFPISPVHFLSDPFLSTFFPLALTNMQIAHLLSLSFCFHHHLASRPCTAFVTLSSWDIITDICFFLSLSRILHLLWNLAFPLYNAVLSRSLDKFLYYHFPQ